MLKVVLVSFALIFASNFTYADALFKEAKPSPLNYDLIKKDIEDSNSSFYYSKLLQKYFDNDRSLTLQDYRHLYYGFVYNEKIDLNDYYMFDDDNYCCNSDNPNVKEYSINSLLRMVESSKLELKRTPFKLSLLKRLNFAYKELGEKDSADFIYYKIKAIKGTILSSGDGKSMGTAFYANNPSDESEILKELNLKFEESPIFNDDFDIYKINKSGYENIYFNVAKSVELKREKVARYKKYRKFYDEAYKFQNEHEYSKAISSYKKALVYDSTNYNLNRSIMLAYEDNSDYDSALIYANILTDKFPEKEFFCKPYMLKRGTCFS